MSVWLYIIAVVSSYLIASINPAILISKHIYHTDVRQFGSHNPGFTNFKRVFGNKHAYVVFSLDVLKAMLLCLIFGLIFRAVGGYYQVGAAFSGMFALLGHAYPIWHGFGGGKGSAAILGVFLMIDWRVGLIAFALFVVLLLTIRFMSLAVMLAAVSVPVLMALFGVQHISVIWMVCVIVLFVIARHHENIGRLINGTESKFRFHAKGTNEPPKE